MTATERLRELLDERGVEWKEHRHMVPGSMAIRLETLWGQPIDNTTGKPIPHFYHNRATEMGDGRLFLEAQLVTPEQAIAATLGVSVATCERQSVADLEAENTKLRELLYDIIVDTEELAKAMREIGIEVEE